MSSFLLTDTWSHKSHLNKLAFSGWHSFICDISSPYLPTPVFFIATSNSQCSQCTMVGLGPPITWTDFTWVVRPCRLSATNGQSLHEYPPLLKSLIFIPSANCATVTLFGSSLVISWIEFLCLTRASFDFAVNVQTSHGWLALSEFSLLYWMFPVWLKYFTRSIIYLFTPGLSIISTLRFQPEQAHHQMWLSGLFYEMPELVNKK